jgi:signal transduction histidine kinase
MYDAANHFIGFSGTCQDITEKKEAELVLEENKQLKQSKDQLQEFVETKDKFISIIAHDLRSPFNSIIGFLELLRTKYDEFSDSERKEHITLIAENANSTLNHLEKLLEWAKSQTGKMAFQPIKQKLMPIIDSVMETLSTAIIHKNLHLKIHGPQDIEIFADPNMLFSVFQNLISNAIKYSRPEGTIELHVREIENQIEIVVSDDGIGMSQETMNRLFKVGEDISNPGTHNEKGSGLGLILCKDFVERHGGSLVVKSEQGKGSQFGIKIPQIGESTYQKKSPG